MNGDKGIPGFGRGETDHRRFGHLACIQFSNQQIVILGSFQAEEAAMAAIESYIANLSPERQLDTTGYLFIRRKVCKARLTTQLSWNDWGQVEPR